MSSSTTGNLIFLSRKTEMGEYLARAFDAGITSSAIDNWILEVTEAMCSDLPLEEKTKFTKLLREYAMDIALARSKKPLPALTPNIIQPDMYDPKYYRLLAIHRDDWDKFQTNLKRLNNYRKGKFRTIDIESAGIVLK